jgi:hypothetical protein
VTQPNPKSQALNPKPQTLNRAGGTRHGLQPLPRPTQPRGRASPLKPENVRFPKIYPRPTHDRGRAHIKAHVCSSSAAGRRRCRVQLKLEVFLEPRHGRQSCTLLHISLSQDPDGILSKMKRAPPNNTLNTLDIRY